MDPWKQYPPILLQKISQVDHDGHMQILVDEIIDHQKDNTALSNDEARSNINGVPRSRFTTIGWSVLVSWKYGSCNWVTLKEFKDSYLVQLAECVIRAGI